jgi:hypothetical protein
MWLVVGSTLVVSVGYLNWIFSGYNEDGVPYEYLKDYENEKD